MDLTEQLWELHDPKDQFRLIFKYLEYIIHKNEATPDRGIQYAVTRIMQGKGVVSLKHIQSELNLSERTFERKFDQHVGLSPMLLAGIAQFQAALQQLKSGKFFKLSDIAYDNGYADQSHFIRSFKKFTGVSPLRFRKQYLSDLFYF
jgi:AraC-like DNA-binding protein